MYLLGGIALLVRTSVSNQTYHILQNQILTGRYKLGDHINIAQLSTELGVSNTPIREALSKLESEGLVTKTGSKYQVIEISEKQNNDMDQMMKISMLGAFELCVEKQKLDELYLSLKEAYQKQRELFHSDDYYGYIRATIDFDRVFITVADNIFLISTLENITAIFTLFVSNKHRADQTSNFQEHAAILEAIRQKDVELARTLLLAHYTKPLSKFPTKD